MRWSELFADLEGQAIAWEQADIDAEVADRSRAEQATVAMSQRLSAAVGSMLTVRLAGVGEVGGRLEALGADWLLLGGTGSADVAEALVLVEAVLAVRDLGRRAEPGAARSAVMARLGVGSPLRAIARDRVSVRCRLRDGSDLGGTLERVGADHLDLACHDPGTAARPSEVRARVTMPFSAVAMVGRGARSWG